MKHKVELPLVGSEKFNKLVLSFAKRQGISKGEARQALLNLAKRQDTLATRRLAQSSARQYGESGGGMTTKTKAANANRKLAAQHKRNAFNT